MDSTMTPPSMTDGQIDKAVEQITSKFRKELRDHRDELPSGAVQIVLGQKDFFPTLYAEFRTRVEAISQTSVVEVDYDDPQWQEIDGNRYAFVGDVRVKDYPETQTGKKQVRFRELEFDHDFTDDEVLAKAAELNCRQPSRAEVETYIRRRYTPEQLAKNPRIGITGQVVKRNDNLNRADVSGNEDGVMLGWDWAGRRWPRHCRVVVVCK